MPQFLDQLQRNFENLHKDHVFSFKDIPDIHWYPLISIDIHWYPLISLGIVVKKLNPKTQHNTYLFFKKTSSNLIIIPTAGFLPLLGSKRPRQWAMSARESGKIRAENVERLQFEHRFRMFSLILYTYIIPICSMYGIFTYIWVIYGVNVGKYSMHGAYIIYTYVSTKHDQVGCWVLEASVI